MIGSNSIREIQVISRERANRWHHGDFQNWSTLEWAGAMCGEAGEAANIAKKLKRIEDNLSGNLASAHVLQGISELRRELASECAGTFLYLCLLMSSEGLDFQRAIASEFNRKSIALGFPERIIEDLE